ncbi:hypothetical protein GGI21_003547, partial [Coemansia aciculifera]
MAVDGDDANVAAASPVELVADTMAATAAQATPAATAQNVPATVKRVEANQVAWTCDNTRVMASNNLGTVLAFDPHSGEVLWRRRAHSVVDVYVLIPHPTDPRVAVSGGYDGRAIVWDVDRGLILREIKVGEQLYDGAFTEDGQYFALASESGAATLYGLGAAWPYEDAQRMAEQMFASDYTATIMDANRFVADQHTQIPSYLVPHSALMDFDGRVYRRQKGPRFGLSIHMGVDELLFAQEDAARRAALATELAHAHIDFQAAQDPMADVRPTRANRRRRIVPPRGQEPEELPEAESLPPVLIPDDSDDEEYQTFGDDDDEDEEPEDDADEDEHAFGATRRAEPAAGRITGRTRQDVEAGSTAYASDRDRQSALELLRTRHSRASARAQRSSDVQPNGDARRRGRLRRDPGASQQQEQQLYELPETSDDDFHPTSAAANQPTRAGGSGWQSRSRRGANVSGSRADRNGRQTRNRRIASDSEEDDDDDNASDIVDVPASDDDNASILDIEGDIDDYEEDSGSEFSDSAVRASTPTRRRSGRTGSNTATRSSAEGGGGTPQSRSLRARSGSYEHARRNLMEHHGADFVSQMADASMEDHTRMETRNGRVPRSNDNIISSSEEDSDSGRPQRRLSKRSQLVAPAGSNNNNAPSVVTRRSAATTVATAASAMRMSSGKALYQPTEWILATAPSTVPYRPQVGDIIAYFREGHEDFWKSPSRCKKLSDKLLPYVEDPDLAVAVFGKVVGLRYHVGPPTFCSVNIQLLKNQTIEELDLEGSDSHDLA